MEDTRLADFGRVGELRRAAVSALGLDATGAAKFGEGEMKRDDEGPGMEKKKLAKIKEEEESGAAVDGARANGVLLAGVV